MANSAQARKRVRQAIKRTEANKPFRTRAARALRDARTAIRTGSEDAGELVRAAASALDRAARRNIIHPNAASRRKSRLAHALKAASLPK
ncbi:MAG: 30S ribosomal protein S20 [Chloroflexi bacterium HGW-Chloroflexi-9]|nr:MAG: 30S ribosomal protein S20 [Chloroflexi bacterium HGW-Chloroflexi-9]